MLALDSLISEIERELRVAGNELRQVTPEWKRTVPKDRGRWMLPEVTSLGWRDLEPTAPRQNSVRQTGDVNCEDTLVDQRSVSSGWSLAEKEKQQHGENLRRRRITCPASRWR